MATLVAGGGVIGSTSGPDPASAPTVVPGSAIVAVELVRVALPLVTPLRSAHGSEDLREVVLVAVHAADGQVGWGECSALARPTYTAEHTSGAWAVLRDELVPALLAGRASGVVGHPMAAAGLATAVLDERLRREARTLTDLLAGGTLAGPVPSVAVAAVVGRARSIDAGLAAIALRVGEGATLVKLKASPAARDLDLVAAARDAWPDLALAVDFNGTADVPSLRRLDPLGLAYVEQPAPPDDLVASAALAEHVGAPVALDESITSRGDLAAAVALGAGRVVNVKPARVGGPEAAAELVALARSAGLACFVGGMLETGIGRAAALAVAALPGCTLPTDLGPSSRYFAEDLTDPLELDDAGRLVLPTGPGIGRIPDADRLAAVTTDRIVVGS